MSQASGTPWRSRVILHTGADLAAADYPVRESIVRVHPSQTMDLPLHLRLADIVLPSSPNQEIQDAVIRSHELVQELLDRISVVSFGKANLAKWFSTCPYRVCVGDRFQLATLDCHAFVSPAPLLPADVCAFEGENENSPLLHVSHLVRLALTAQRSDEQFRHLFAILERLAEIECTDIIPQKCPLCKESFSTGRKATSNYIRALLLEFGISNAKASRYISLRGRIAHGEGPFDQKFAHAVTTACGELMGHVMSLVAERLGVTILRVDNIVTYLPVAVYTCELTEPSEIQYHKIEFKGAVTWPKVTRNGKVNEGGYSQFGLEFDAGMKPRIEPFAWPDTEAVSANWDIEN